MQYYRGNIYSQVLNYYYQTLSQFQNFSTSGQGVMSEHTLPLITVEMEISKRICLTSIEVLHVMSSKGLNLLILI